MGSIANRPSQDELDRLRMEAAALVERVGDERIVARFFIAESFLPFWLGSVTKPDVSQFDAAETAATRALSIAERLDDARLQSAARDGLAAVQTLRGQARAALKTNYPRLALEDRVDLLERMDAYGVITWAHCWLGELDDAARVSAAGLALLQPGQVPAWALHVVAWRAYALALRGFAAAFGVAHARGAEAAAERYREAIEEIERAFIARQGPRQERYLAFVRDDAHAMHAAIAERFPYDHRVIELWERLYARLADLAYAVDADLAQRVIAFAVRYEYRALEASARRAFGVGADDQAELRRALEIFDAIGAVPYSARTRCELAQRTGDRMMFDAGARVLDGLGDVDQLRRYEDLFGR